MIKRAAILILLAASVLTHAADEPAGFKQAIEPRTLNFPNDHGSHAGFETEWWYVTGNLNDGAGHEFGYQFTIFRRAADVKSAQERGRTSVWAPTDFYLGHLAISDISGKQFSFEEDLMRGAADLAGATEAGPQDKNPDPIKVWLREWSMIRTANGWTLKAAQGDIALDLSLTETLQPVLHGRPGEEGLSHKGAKPGQASYYYSVPQLTTTGSLSLKSKAYAVTGKSWMDHEFGSNQLSKDQAGWEWFAIELTDGSALMLYQLRNRDGSLEPASSGTWTDAQGKSTHLPASAFKTTSSRAWVSPKTERKYALDWHVEISGAQIALDVRAAQDDQEVRSAKSAGISYYEGAVHVSGSVSGKSVSGFGYLEITGAPSASGKSEAQDSLGGRL